MCFIPLKPRHATANQSCTGRLSERERTIEYESEKKKREGLTAIASSASPQALGGLLRTVGTGFAKLITKIIIAALFGFASSGSFSLALSRTKLVEQDGSLP